MNDRVLITHWRSGATAGFVGVDRVVATSKLTTVLSRLALDPTAHEELVVGPAPPEILVCGHGRRDRCCGRMGTVLAQEVAGRWPGIRVRRCSHTGGHRFAPTGLTLPDGRAWAYLDAETLDGIITRTMEPVDLRSRYRGTSALGPWAQVVERSMFERFGWAWCGATITACDVTPSAPERSATVTLEWKCAHKQGTTFGQVEIGRELPILNCGNPPDESTKLTAELLLSSFRIEMVPMISHV